MAPWCGLNSLYNGQLNVPIAAAAVVFALAAGDRSRAGLPAQPVGPEHAHQRVVDALAHLAPEEFHQRALGPRFAVPQQPRQRARARAAAG